MSIGSLNTFPRVVVMSNFMVFDYGNLRVVLTILIVPTLMTYDHHNILSFLRVYADNRTVNDIGKPFCKTVLDDCNLYKCVSLYRTGEDPYISSLCLQR